MDWGIYQPRVRFDIRAEREEYERLYYHYARVLQDRLVRRSRTHRSQTPAIPEWEKIHQLRALECRLLHQARVLGWGEEKRYYFARKAS